MEYNTFKETILKSIKKEYASEEVTVELRQVTKNNGVKKDGLLVWYLLGDGKGKIAPTIYLEKYYGRYKHLGTPMEEIVQEIKDVLKNNKRDDLKLHAVMGTWEERKGNLQLQLINYSANEERLKDYLHYRYLDLAVVPRLIIEHSDAGILSMRIDKKCLKDWGVSKELVFEAAYHNLKEEEFVCTSLSELLGTDPEEDIIDLHILTNKFGQNGSIAMLRRDLLEKFADGSDVFILPSSIHEVMLLRDQFGDKIDTKAMKLLISNANAEVVGEDEVLSSNLYKFDVVKREIVIVE